MTRRLQRDFHFAGQAFRVEGPEEPVRWLEDFVEPQFAARDTDDAPVETIRFFVDAREHAHLAACGPHAEAVRKACFTLDSGIVEGRVWNAADGAEVVFEDARDVFYRRRPDEPSTIEIIAARDTATGRVALMRVLREYAMLHAARGGWVMLHAAAVCIGDEAFVIAGPKKAGKTTVLLHALRNERGTYVSNDRVALHAGPSGLMVYGIPTIVSIRRESTAWFPGLDPKLRGVRYDARPTVADRETPAPVASTAWSLSPRQLCEIVGAESRAVARVAGILYPQVDASTPGATLEELASAEARRALDAARFRSCPTDGMFRVRDGAPAELQAGAMALANRVIDDVPSFLCRLGPDAYRDGVRWLSCAARLRAQTSRGYTSFHTRPM